MSGGARKKLKATTGQMALLDAIWKRAGGVGELAQKVDVHKQAPVNWRLRGKVPLKHCRRVADALNLNKTQEWGLNYNDMFLFYRKSAPSWSEVIRSFEFPADTYKAILSLKAPKNSFLDDK